MNQRPWLAIELAAFGAIGGLLCACGAMPEQARPIVNDKVIAAVKANDVEAVRVLLQQGASADSRESGDGVEDGYTALLYAVEHQFLPLTHLLLRSGANPTFPGGHQAVFPLLKAARAGEPKMLVLLIDYGANINQKRPGDGMDALAVACLEGHLPIVDMLVARNTVVEPQDLGYAIGSGHLEIARRLLDAGADPAWTFNGRTMIQVARESPGRTRGDLETLVERYMARRKGSAGSRVHDLPQTLAANRLVKWNGTRVLRARVDSVLNSGEPYFPNGISCTGGCVTSMSTKSRVGSLRLDARA